VRFSGVRRVLVRFSVVHRVLVRFSVVHRHHRRNPCSGL
jgi:hypothetical protein